MKEAIKETNQNHQFPVHNSPINQQPPPHRSCDRFQSLDVYGVWEQK